MKTINTDVINRVNLSSINLSDALLAVYSIVANCASSRENFVKLQHNHSFFELHYLLEGTVVYELQGRSITVTRDHYLIIPPRIPHKIIYHSDDFVKLSISFQFDPAYDLFQTAQLARKRVFETSPEIKACIDFVLDRAEHRGELSQRLIKLRLHELIFLVADSIAQPSMLPADTERSDDRLLRAKKYIEDNPHIFFTCAEVADYCHTRPCLVRAASAILLSPTGLRHITVALCFHYIEELNKCKRMAEIHLVLNRNLFHVSLANRTNPLANFINLCYNSSMRTNPAIRRGFGLTKG